MPASTGGGGDRGGDEIVSDSGGGSGGGGGGQIQRVIVEHCPSEHSSALSKEQPEKHRRNSVNKRVR